MFSPFFLLQRCYGDFERITRVIGVSWHSFFGGGGRVESLVGESSCEGSHPSLRARDLKAEALSLPPNQATLGSCFLHSFFVMWFLRVFCTVDFVLLRLAFSPVPRSFLPLAGFTRSCALSERTKAAPGKGQVRQLWPLLPHMLPSLKVF